MERCTGACRARGAGRWTPAAGRLAVDVPCRAVPAVPAALAAQCCDPDSWTTPLAALACRCRCRCPSPTTVGRRQHDQGSWGMGSFLACSHVHAHVHAPTPSASSRTARPPQRCRAPDTRPDAATSSPARRCLHLRLRLHQHQLLRLHLRLRIHRRGPAQSWAAHPPCPP